jgi:hypothetical protein
MVLTDKNKYEIIIRNEKGESIKYITKDMKININTVKKMNI